MRQTDTVAPQLIGSGVRPATARRGRVPGSARSDRPRVCQRGARLPVCRIIALQGPRGALQAGRAARLPPAIAKPAPRRRRGFRTRRIIAAREAGRKATLPRPSPNRHSAGAASREPAASSRRAKQEGGEACPVVGAGAAQASGAENLPCVAGAAAPAPARARAQPVGSASPPGGSRFPDTAGRARCRAMKASPLSWMPRPSSARTVAST